MRVKKQYVLDIKNGENIISESFGLQNGYIVNICDIDIPDDYSVIFITGESGSGKSTIAREMFGDKIINLPEKQLYLLNGESLEQQKTCIKILGECGITDALQFVSLPSQLSDSQKERAKIAYQIMLGEKIIVVDEFLSTLDRKTAKSVAYCIQKAIRREGKKLIAVTAHEDIEEFLMPDYTIRGESFPSKFTIKKNNYNKKENPFVNEIKYHYGDKYEYRDCDLGLLHYKGKYTGGTKEFLFATINSKIVAVLVSTYNRATGGRRISRVVVHPSYRGVGIGKEIVIKYLKNYPQTDVIATMALFNPIFEKAGMKRVEDSITKSPKNFSFELQNCGFDLKRWHEKEYCLKMCIENIKIREIISKYSKYAHDFVCPGGKYIEDDEIKEKIFNDPNTAARVLFNLREKRYAKYVYEV